MDETDQHRTDPHGLGVLMDDIRLNIANIASANQPMCFRLTVNEVNFNRARVVGQLDGVRRLMANKDDAAYFVKICTDSLQSACDAAIARTKRSPRSRAD